MLILDSMSTRWLDRGKKNSKINYSTQKCDQLFRYDELINLATAAVLNRIFVHFSLIAYTVTLHVRAVLSGIDIQRASKFPDVPSVKALTVRILRLSIEVLRCELRKFARLNLVL